MFAEDLDLALSEIERRINWNDRDKRTCDHPILLHKHWNAENWGIVGEFARDRVVALTNADFARGTLRVLVPCKLVFCESISFNPNAGEVGASGRIERSRSTDWLPLPEQPAYLAHGGPAPHPSLSGLAGGVPTLAYRLGFFAAIAVEHQGGTIIDLNGFTLACHPHFALQQRFHALIELANQPFVSGQGPAQFGQELRPARHVWIRNGTLGLSPHHGVHGNGMQDILISDVTFKDFEVAAVSLNGGRRIVVRDCQVDGNLQKVPILGTYSAARFLRFVSQGVLAKAGKIEPRPDTLRQALVKFDEAMCELDAVMDDTFDHIFARNASPEKIDPIFRNASGLVDANPYGMVFHARGVLVNGFLCNGPALGQSGDAARAFESSDIAVIRTNIAGIKGEVRETLALATIRRKPGSAELVGDSNGFLISDTAIADSSGSLFRFFPLLAPDEIGGCRRENSSSSPRFGDPQPGEMDLKTGKASLSVLGKAQMRFAVLLKAIRDAAPDSEPLLINTKVPDSLLDWAEETSGLMLRQAEAKETYGNSSHQVWELRRDGENQAVDQFLMHGNADIMFHVNKGAIGLFAQGVDGLTLDRVSVSDVENQGWPGSDLPGNYLGVSDGGHPKQGRQIGYSGADSRGVHIGACTNVAVKCLSVSGVRSAYGSATGIGIVGGSINVEAATVNFGLVQAGHGYDDAHPMPQARWPNLLPEPLGLFVDRFSHNVRLRQTVHMGMIEPAQSAWQSGRTVRIESAGVTVE